MTATISLFFPIRNSEQDQSEVKGPSPEFMSVTRNPNTLTDLFEFKTTGVRMISPCLLDVRDWALITLPVGEINHIKLG